MTYEIEIPPGIAAPEDLDLIHDNPKSTKLVVEELLILFPNVKFQILRNGKTLRMAEFDADLKSFEISQVREDSSKLPSTYRKGWSNTTDEIATGSDGNPTKVWDPENPEERFSEFGRPKPRN